MTTTPLSPLDADGVAAAIDAAIAAVTAATTLDELKAARLAHTGDRSRLTLANREIGRLEPKDKATAGKLLGQARGRVQQAIAARQAELEAAEEERRLREERVDVTLPVERRPRGARHPLETLQEEIADFFVSLGWDIAEGPEVEHEWLNFDALNHGPDHPARQMADTFYVQGTAEQDTPGLVLRTHTSPVQARTLLERSFIIRRDGDHSVIAGRLRPALVDWLRTEQPERYRSLNDRLARHRRRHGEPTTALTHAVQAEAWPLVLGILEENWAELLRHHAGRLGTIVRTMPAELVARMQPTAFLGHDGLEATGVEVVAILRDGVPVQALAAGEQAIVFLDRTPFYAESGGQVGDAGTLVGAESRFQVDDTRKLAGQFHGHLGRLAAGSLRVGDRVLGAVGDVRRGNIVLNHSATHLLHGALRELLGTHVQQKGSLVAPDRLRFDFSHFEPVAREELAEIERRVNREVRANHPVLIREMGMQEAMDAGAIALFGEKYGERVRVVKMGGSVELCGGTHVGRTGEIGLFKLVSEGGVSAGVRRVEALTGEAALDHVATGEGQLHQAAGLLGGTSAEVSGKLRVLVERQKKLERELESLKAKAASGATADLAANAVDVQGIKVLAARLEGFDAKALREAVDQLKDRLKDTVVVLAGTSDGKASLVAGVGGAASGRIRAGDLLKHVAGRIGGKGGGRPDLAQGGGPDGPALVEALSEVNDWVSERLN